MIIRKPYAFLIKHFKLIHFVMLVLSICIVNRANIIFNFFNEYVTTRQVSSAEYISSNYLPLFLFISSILIITLSIIIFILLKQKDKPKLLYIIIIIYYILFIIFLIIAGMVISTIYIEGLSPQLSRIYRDISLIALIIQIIFIVLIAIRAVGFDIKKFHFGEDLQELQIEVTDNEEIEITSGIDFDKISRNLQIKKEDFKSFYIENKAMIIIILFLMIIVIPGSFIIRNIVNNKHFQQGEIIKLNNFDMSIKSSYTTKYNYNGNLKLKENKSYLIIEFYLKNNKQKKSSINLNSLTLESNNHIYSPNTSNYNSFIDIGIGYDSQALLFNEEKKYIAVFIVDDEDITNNMNIRYTDDPTSKILNYKRIDIMPMNLDNDIKKENIKIGEIINLNKTLLLNTTLEIKEYDIKDYYTCTIDEKEKTIVNTNGLVLKLTYEFIKDKNISFITDFNEFLNKYATISYVYKEITHNEKIENITPTNYNLNDVYLAVNEEIKDATNIYIEFSIRNISYKIILK